MADDVGGLLRRARSIAADLADDEVLLLRSGRDFWTTRPLDRVGLPSIRMTDGPHGVTSPGEQGGSATCFPTGVCIASSWNTELAEAVGAAVAREARSRDCAMLLGPCVDIHRGPLNGRNYESYSEDPYLAGAMAAAFVRGAQGEGIACCVKHFTCNNRQTRQEITSAEVSERTLQEMHVPAFAAAIRTGGAWSVMTAYNLVNGEHCSENTHLVRGILKDQLGLRGPVLSDWRGVHSTRAAIAGLDLEMPGPGSYLTPEALAPLLGEGRLTRADLEDSAARLIALVLWARLQAHRPGEMDTPRHREIARRVAADGIVLLKNEEELLPLDRRGLRSVAVIGPNAAHARLGGGGSSSVTPPYAVSPLEALRALAGPETEVRYEEGCSLAGGLPAVEGACLRPPRGRGAEGLLGAYYAGPEPSGAPLMERIDPSVDFSWGWASPAPQVPSREYAVRWEGELRAATGGKHLLGVSCDHGAYRLHLDGVPIFDEWEIGDTFEERYAARARTAEVTLEAERWYPLRLDFRKTGARSAIRLEWQRPDAEDPIDRAARCAAESDAAVIFVGLSNRFEGGNNDRVSLDLPGRQDELVKRVAAANPRTAVVLIGGSPVATEGWVERVPALLEAWYPGQEGGTAIAEVLFGEVNPSGRLPDTFPRRIEDTPSYESSAGAANKVPYHEGVFVGYRHYDARGIEPRFAFGHGLSYTTFDYGTPRASGSRRSTADPRIAVSVNVTNGGKRSGQEVVQLYVSPSVRSAEHPPKELKAFRKILLDPGQARTVRFTLGADAFSTYDPRLGRWTVEPGEYRILVGGRPDTLSGVTVRLVERG